MNTKHRKEVTSYFASNQMVGRTSCFGRKYRGVFRSKYEYLFSNSLNNLKIEHMYEPYAFMLMDENGVKIHYIPDFYIINTNLFIEISTNTTRQRKHKILCFQEQYPDLVLMLMNTTDIKDWLRGKFDIFLDEYTDKEIWTLSKIESIRPKWENA